MQGEFEFYKRLPVRPARPERLFFCLLPDVATSVRVRQFAERLVCDNWLKGTLLKAERLHVSLQHVGDDTRLRTKVVYAARLAGDAVSMRAFELAFPFLQSFGPTALEEDVARRRPLVLLGEGDALLELHAMLGAAMEKNGLKARPHFTPHMTLLYGSKALPHQAIEPIRFTVREFVLIHSELGLTRYNVVERWPLDD